MKKVLGFLLMVLLLACSMAVAEVEGEWIAWYPKAAKSRLVYSVPEGMNGHLTEKREDGYLSLIIRSAEISKTEWKQIMINGGYPYIRVEVGVKNPSGYETCISFSGDIFGSVSNDFFNDFANTLSNESVWYSNCTTMRNGEQVGEIVADQCMLLPRNGNIGGGYFICWMDLDKYLKLYPLNVQYDSEGNIVSPAGWFVDHDGVIHDENGQPVVRHRFTAEEIRENKDGIFHFEYVETGVQWDTEESFYVPFRSVSATTLEPTWDAPMPTSKISVNSIKNGDITFLANGLTDDVDVPVVLSAPSGAVKAAVYDPILSNLTKVLSAGATLTVSNGTVTYLHEVHRDVCVSEDQLSVVWLDSNNEMVDYGVFWLHVETPNYAPRGTYVRTVTLDNGHTVTWEKPVGRVTVENNSEHLGVTASYDGTNSLFRIGYEEVTEVNGMLGDIVVKVKAPANAKAACVNDGGRNQIMGPDANLAQNSHHIIVNQSYIKTQEVDEDNNIVVFNAQPLRYYQAGPVDVYIQLDSVWPYGGGDYVIYWYESVAAANDPESRAKPIAVDYIAKMTDSICVTARTEIVDSEADIQESVENVTCVKPGYSNKDWHLVIHRYPQRGDHACHWELYLENECGDYEPLEDKTVFYTPYPNGHQYDHERACAVDSQGNECTYEIYHYNANHDKSDLVIAQPMPVGIRFEVSSLSPFVLNWGDSDFNGGSGNENDDNNNNDNNNNNDSSDNQSGYNMDTLRLDRGVTIMTGGRFRNVQAFAETAAYIKGSYIENLSVDLNFAPAEEDQWGEISILGDTTYVQMLNFCLSKASPDKTLVVTDGEGRIDALFVILMPGYEPTGFSNPLVQTNKEMTVGMLCIEGDYNLYDPSWFPDIIFEEVQIQDERFPIPYDAFMAKIGK